MKRILSLSVLAALAVSVLFIGCQPKGDIKIGVLLPLTGPLSEPGTQSLDGVKLAVDQYNARSPKVKVILAIEDSKGSPADGVSAFRKLTDVDKVRLVIGDLISGVTLAVAPIAEEKKVVVLAPGSSNPKVRDAGDYIFRNWASDNFDGQVMARYLAEKEGKKRAVIIYTNTDYGAGLAGAFKAEFQARNGTVVLEEPFDEGATDFRTTLGKLKGISFDCLYLCGQPKEDGFLVRQMKELGISTLIASNLGVESPDFFAIAKGAGDGIVYSTPAFDPSSHDTTVVAFVRAFEEKFGHKPDVVGGHGYDAARLLLDALSRANFNQDRVKEMLYQTRDFPGVTGVSTFDDKGDVSKSVMIKRLGSDGIGKVLLTYQP